MSEEHNNGAPVFLETTIQIDRVIGDQQDRDDIKRNVAERQVCTSGHVLGEFNKTLIRDAIIFRDLLLTSPTVEEAVLRLERITPQNRRFRRTVRLLAHLTFDGDRQIALERLEDFIEWRAYDHFWDSIDQSCYTNEVKCVLQAWRPILSPTKEYDTTGLKCLKNSPPPCQVQDFIKNNSSDIESVISSINSDTPKRVVDSSEAFKAILAGQDVPFGERSNCWRIADMLIVLEATPGCEIYSRDQDIRAIAKILGIPVVGDTPVQS